MLSFPSLSKNRAWPCTRKPYQKVNKHDQGHGYVWNMTAFSIFFKLLLFHSDASDNFMNNGCNKETGCRLSRKRNVTLKPREANSEPVLLFSINTVLHKPTRSCWKSYFGILNNSLPLKKTHTQCIFRVRMSKLLSMKTPEVSQVLRVKT